MIILNFRNQGQSPSAAMFTSVDRIKHHVHLILNDTRTGWHDGAVVNIATSQQEGAEFKPAVLSV